MTEENKMVLEEGDYVVYSKNDKDIEIGTIELKSPSGSHRIWKVKSMNEKEIVLDIVKFG